VVKPGQEAGSTTVEHEFNDIQVPASAALFIQMLRLALPAWPAAQLQRCCPIIYHYRLSANHPSLLAGTCRV